jgi:ERCC4-related helicase
LLARPVVRALLAHDAGAGKTIMAGMVIKELRRRQGARRILIVAPKPRNWARPLDRYSPHDYDISSL